MREPSADDFFLDLPDVGTFRYGRRTIGDRLAIRRDYLRYTQEFGDDDPDLSLYAALIATHDTLCVSCPAGWESIAAIPASKMEKAFELGALIKSTEDTFAKGVEKSGALEGAGSAGDGGVPLSPHLQPASDGPEISGNDSGGHAR